MFSKELKEATKESHSAAENTKFVAGFLRGVVDPEEYRKLIANFWYVYSTMERLIHDADDPTVKVLQGWQWQLDRDWETTPLRNPATNFVFSAAEWDTLVASFSSLENVMSSILMLLNR